MQKFLERILMKKKNREIDELVTVLTDLVSNADDVNDGYDVVIYKSDYDKILSVIDKHKKPPPVTEG